MQTLLDTSKLPAVIRRQLEAFLEDNGLEKHGVEIQHLTPREAFDYWLKWNGIIGWTDSIIEALDAIRAAEVK